LRIPPQAGLIARLLLVLLISAHHQDRAMNVEDAKKSVTSIIGVTLRESLQNGTSGCGDQKNATKCIE
jgi:hypothetical protein